MGLPENSRVLYRILSEKSRLGFGKYADLTVRDVLKINPPYIVWLYYRQSNISLRPELIEELDIIPIAKPGTNEDMYWEWRDNREQKFSEEEKSHGRIALWSRQQRKAKGRLRTAIIETSLSKAQLQAINHGHKK